MTNLFKLRAPISKKADAIIAIFGIFMFIIIWAIIANSGLISNSLLPTPWAVFTAYHELHFEDLLLRNLGYSLFLNFSGYFEAVLVSIPLGFILGLYPFFRSLSSKPINTFRYIPLTAITGLFIAWFGIGDIMKIQFLAFGIFVYLLPVVVQKIAEVDDVYTQTSYTLGATQWQMIKSVFWPSVISRISDDIRVLIAISWTYIIVAELVNKTGGVGAMIFQSAKQSRIDKVFAILIVIVVVGYLQDKLLLLADKWFFPYKYKGNGRV